MLAKLIKCWASLHSAQPTRCSITDACLGWDDTVTVLHKLAAAVAERRKKA